MRNKNRLCPICMYNKSKLLYTQRFAGHFEHKIFSCLFCGFIYVDSISSKKYYDDYYEKQSKYEGTRQHEIHDEPTYKTIDFILKKYIPRKSKILDVGCSTGKLLYFIKQKGYKNLLGVEPAPECKLIAKTKYKITVETNTFRYFKTKEKFDLIIFSEVLEHLIDIRKAVIKAYSLLSDNGKIFVGVPDAENFHKKFNEPFGEFSTEHINFFSRKSLLFLLNKLENIFMISDSNCLFSLWKKNNSNNSYLDRYITRSNSKMKKILKTIELLPNNIIVWGVGALTQRLLKTTNLKNKIFKFVDSNKNLIGKKIEGLNIISPDEIIKFKNPILISSFSYKKEIFEQIKKMKIPNKIITFKTI